MRGKPGLIVATMVVVGLGIFFLVFWAATSGGAAWIAVGLVIAAVVVAAAVLVARRPRGAERTPFAGGAAPVADGGHRVLLVIDDVCDAGELERLRATSVLVVAPAASSRLDRLTGDETAYHDAEQHLEATLESLRALGIEAAGHIGSHDPLQAADDGLREFAADEIAFVLGERGETEWLEAGVVELARSRYGVPVRELGTASSS